MKVSKKIFLMGFLLFLMGVILNENLISSEQISGRNDLLNEEGKEYISPIMSVSDPFNKSNLFNIFSEDFETNEYDVNFDEYIINGGTITMEKDVQDDYVEIKGYDQPFIERTEEISLIYNQPISEFHIGTIYFDYTFNDNWGNSQLHLEVTNGDTNNSIWSVDTSGSGSAKVEIPKAYSLDPDFNFHFYFTGRTDLDYATLDDIILETYEFAVEEKSGDPVDVYQDQDLSVFIYPGFSDLGTWHTDNVTCRYNINSADMSSATELNASETSNNFTFTIPQTEYSSYEIIYYQFSISSSSEGVRSSDIFSFETSDGIAPSISNVITNKTTYYNDVLLTCDIEDDTQGVGLDSITLYFGFSENPTSADTVINTINGSIPSSGGNFHFIIDASYISAREENNYYTINATDSAGNSGYVNGNFTVSDDIPPNIQFIQTNASGSGIENNKSLKITYNITEPWDGIGLNPLTINLSYSINAPPASSSDRDGIVWISEFPPTLNGGLVNFTLDESIYDNGDTIYFYVNASDLAGNHNCSYPIVQSVSVIDTLAPSVVNWSSNSDPTSYNVSKTLYFTINEPLGGSGIDNNSLILYFEVGGSWSSPIAIEKNITKFGGDISFTINENNYTYGDIVQYQLNVSDLEGNKYSSAIGQFYVGDLFAPQLSWSSYNNSNPQYYQDFNITFWMREDGAGSHFSTAELFVKNSSAEWIDAIQIFKTNRTSVYDLSGLVYIEFEVNASITYARWELDWKLEVYDIANNYNNITGSIRIRDEVLPNMIYLGNNGTNDEFEYYDNAEISFSISEPIQGSGFNTDGSNITLYYKTGSAPSNAGDIEGEFSVKESIISDFGGTYTFIISESVFYYGIDVYFWINASDIQKNENTTFSNVITLKIIDTVIPLIELDTSFNEQEVSYHLDKTIRYNTTEFIDSSQLKNATLYWRKGVAPTTSIYEDYLERPLSGVGGSFSDWDLSRINLSFQYGDEIFFIIVIYDNAGNSITSTSNSFIITDTVNPEYIEDSDNTDDWTYRTNKVLNFTVFDPDYGNSSGIASIRLYYKAGSGVSSSNYDNFTDVAIGDITLFSNYYLMTVYLNETLYHKDSSHRIYYIIRITDIEGNSRDSNTNSFIIYPEVYNLATVQGPENQEWLGDGDVSFSFDLYLETDIRIEINGTEHFTDPDVVFYDDVIQLNIEGEYIINFTFLDGKSYRVFRFYLDLYPPEKISGINFKLFGFEVVEFTWEEPSGIDGDSVYKIYRSSSADFEIGEETYLGEVKAGEPLSFEDNSIEAGKTYYYKVVAIDRVGHISEASDEIKVEVPANILVPIIGLIVVGAIVGIAGAGIYKHSVNKKREKLFSQVDLKKLDEDFDFEDKMGPKEVQWTEIKTKAAPKPEPIIQENGFEFDGQIPVTPTANYWQNKMGHLLSQAAQFEQENEYGDALKVYSLLIRMAKRKNQMNLRSKLQAKVEKIYQNISS